MMADVRFRVKDLNTRVLLEHKIPFIAATPKAHSELARKLH